MPLSIKDSKFIVSGNASLKFSNVLIDEKNDANEARFNCPLHQVILKIPLLQVHNGTKKL